MTPMLRRWTVCAAFAAAVTASAACENRAADGSAETAAAPATPVDLATVAETDWPDQFEAGGILQPRATATIASQILARVSAVTVRAGDMVKRGQTLIALDGIEWTEASRRAAAASDAAVEHVGAASAAADRARAQLTLARATHARMVALTARRAATTEELDEATAALATAEAGVAAADAGRREAVAARDAAAAARKAAEAEAGHLILTSPFDGVVRNRSTDAGSMAVPGAALLVIDQDAPPQLIVRLDPGRGRAIRAQQPVDVLGDADGAGAAASAGVVREIARTGADGSTFEITIDVAAPPGRAGRFARARFAAGTRRTLVVPADAVIRRGQLAFVLVADGDRAHLRAVSLGESAGAAVEVLDGLAAGDRIVRAPGGRLGDGDRITARGARR